MKKVLLTVTLFSALCLSNIQAQKNNLANLKNTELKSEVDSLSYAFGLELADQGLKGYLIQQEVIVDTTSVGADFRKKIAEAKNDKEKAKLEKQLQSKLDSIQNSNNTNIEVFLSGAYDRLNSKDDNSVYNKGTDFGGQLTQISRGFSEQALGKDKSVNTDVLMTALLDALSNKTPLINNSRDMLKSAVEKNQEEKSKENEKLNAAKIAENEKFMTANAKKKGIVSLPSGLQYKIDKKGTGAIPTESDRVKVHYRGTLLDGTEFDSSIKRNEPITFGVTEVIPGWTEALQLMPVGSKWTVYIPYNLAYGERETGSIPPYSNLIFEIELLDIEK